MSTMQHSKEDFSHITDVLSTPTILKGMLENWPSRKWSPEYLASVLKEKKLKIRTGPVSAKKLTVIGNLEPTLLQAFTLLSLFVSNYQRQDSPPIHLSYNSIRSRFFMSQKNYVKDSSCQEFSDLKIRHRDGAECLTTLEEGSVLWETDCVHEEATLDQFCEWLSSEGTPSASKNPLLKYNRDEHWCYVDYKQMSFLFEDHPEILKAVHWTDLGFVDRDGRQSTMWIGSEGAFTPGHYDTYGFNLVAQIYGRKRWHLFPPSQTHLLYPTRIPYEESSVFSPINISNPSLELYPKFADATPYAVTLGPGDVLFVPKHWWHFVESLEASISINTWVEVESDKESRVQESVVRVLVSTLMSTCGPRKWVNPTETICNDEMNYRYVGAALKECSHKSLQPLSMQAASASSESESGKEQAIRNTDLPAYRPNLDRDFSVHTEAVVWNQTVTETRKDGQSTIGDALNSSATRNLQSDINNTCELSSNTSLDTEGRCDLVEKGFLSRDTTGTNPSSEIGLKRSIGDIIVSSSQSKLPKTYQNNSDEDQSAVFSNVVVPVICQGQIYKGNKQDDSCVSDVKPQDGDLNRQMRSEVRPDVSVDDMRQMVVECVTHPAVLSLMAVLLQEKFDHKV